MFKTIVALAFLAIVGMPPASQEPRPSAPSPEQQQTPSKPPAMSEDKRVKTEAIDSVMADPNVVLLDVREPKEIDELGGYEGAVNIPITQLEKRLGELPKDKTILTA
jgi:3-mercaptopyruvate sulfurtransferase SseA